ncbi:MAG: hypothetical protein Q4E53_07130 [Eubacteriales bacterium]|nr:hypothetical protein [Eubacteriales bacterium]
MSEIDIRLNQLADMLLNNEITQEEHVDRYNEIIRSETDEDSLGRQPHEHI